jgi:glycosyltransferase involved in cell wall biosynthesis
MSIQMNLSEPLVTIITPSYNRAWIIQECIDCIKNQSYKNIEHIVIDGASTDHTLDILKREQKNYNLQWISEKDRGVYDAVNKGIKLAKGQIVTYLNTDDFYFPYSVEVIVKKFLESSADIIYGDWLNLDYDTCFMEFLPCMHLNKYDLLLGGYLPQPAVFLRREVFEKIGVFDIDFKLMADNEFFTRAAVQGAKIEKVDEFIAGQMLHGTNLLAGNGNDSVQDITRAEGQRYRSYYLSKQEIPKLDRLVSSIKLEMFKKTYRVKLLLFLFSYVFRGKGWNNFIAYLEQEGMSLKKLLFIKYLLFSGIWREEKKYVYLSYDHVPRKS